MKAWAISGWRHAGTREGLPMYWTSPSRAPWVSSPISHCGRTQRLHQPGWLSVHANESAHSTRVKDSAT